MTEIATGKFITPAQRLAIEALLLSGDVTTAAAAGGVNRSTLYKWRELPHFQQALQAAEQEAIASLSRRLAGLSDAAAKALVDGLAPTEKITTRLRACEVVIGNLLRLRELVNLEARIEALEHRNETA
jgi:transposase-like protein